MSEEVRKTRPVKRKKEAKPIMARAKSVRVAGLIYQFAYLVKLLAPRRVYEQMHTSNGMYRTNKTRSSSRSSFSTDSNTLDMKSVYWIEFKGESVRTFTCTYYVGSSRETINAFNFG